MNWKNGQAMNEPKDKTLTLALVLLALPLAFVVYLVATAFELV